jgi:hypothetical protein
VEKSASLPPPSPHHKPLPLFLPLWLPSSRGASTENPQKYFKKEEILQAQISALKHHTFTTGPPRFTTQLTTFCPPKNRETPCKNAPPTTSEKNL